MIARGAALASSLAMIATAAASARADSHGELGFGGDLLLTGADGDRQRGELLAAIVPGNFGAFGAELTWRDFDRGHAGLVTAGLVYVAGASRPLLELAFHGDLGADLDQHVPVVAGGVRATFGVVDGAGIALDSGAALAIDGIDHSRFAFAASALFVARW